MVQEMISKRTEKHPRGKVHDLLKKHGPEGPDQVNLKRERFLIRLKERYGFTNEKAVDELERLLRQFYRMNRSMNLDHSRLEFKHWLPK